MITVILALAFVLASAIVYACYGTIQELRFQLDRFKSIGKMMYDMHDLADRLFYIHYLGWETDIDYDPMFGYTFEARHFSGKGVVYESSPEALINRCLQVSNVSLDDVVGMVQENG